MGWLILTTLSIVFAVAAIVLSIITIFKNRETQRMIEETTRILEGL